MIRIAIVDDHAMVCVGLRHFFADQVDFVVAAEAANSREALDIVRKRGIDVALLDISMPGKDGVDTLAAIRARAPDLPVLILSGFSEERYATALLRQGASDYLNKDCDPEEIVPAIRTVRRGRKYVAASLAEWLAESLGGSSDKAPHELLSERESQVFLRLAQGETIGHMAESMSLRVKTVSTYRTHVIEKMQLESNSDLTFYALKNGLIQLSRQGTVAAVAGIAAGQAVAVQDQRLDIVGFVEHLVCTKLQTFLAHVRCREVAQHHDVPALWLHRSGTQHAQAGASFKEDVDDQQVNGMLWRGQPLHGRGFVLRGPHDLHRNEFLQRRNEVLSDDGAVFDDVGPDGLHGSKSSCASEVCGGVFCCADGVPAFEGPQRQVRYNAAVPSISRKLHV